MKKFKTIKKKNEAEGNLIQNTNCKKKKKGFTLIELIAVIAILGILAAIAVPNVTGYTNKAKKGKAIADAKIILNAIDARNAEVDNGSDKILDTATVADLKSNTNIVGDNAPIKTDGFPKEFGDAIKVSDLRLVAVGADNYGTGAGKWEVDSAGTVTVHPAAEAPSGS